MRVHLSAPLNVGGMRREVIAAGAVVVRKGVDGFEVLLVHRPRYDDWSFPKGKRDKGEHVTACAVREVAEETGLRIALGVPLDDQTYLLANGRPKRVHYWVARVVGDDDLSSYAANDEIDELRWVDWKQARTLLTHDWDRVTLDEARPMRRSTRTLVLLRENSALSDVTVEAWAPQVYVEADGTDVTALLETVRRVVVRGGRAELAALATAVGVEPNGHAAGAWAGLGKGEWSVVHLRKGAVVASERFALA